MEDIASHIAITARVLHPVEEKVSRKSNKTYTRFAVVKNYGGHSQRFDVLIPETYVSKPNLSRNELVHLTGNVRFARDFPPTIELEDLVFLEPSQVAVRDLSE